MTSVEENRELFEAVKRKVDDCATGAHDAGTTAATYITPSNAWTRIKAGTFVTAYRGRLASSATVYCCMYLEPFFPTHPLSPLLSPFRRIHRARRRQSTGATLSPFVLHTHTHRERESEGPNALHTTWR
jgi:hypothetical protein